MVIPRFLLRAEKQNTPPSDLPWFGPSYGAFAIGFSSLVTLLCLRYRDSRHPRGIALNKALILTPNPDLERKNGRTSAYRRY